jgi:ABC-type antimicrobial peptide transport system permease subunit
MFAVRTAGDPRSIVSALRQAVANVDPWLPLYDVQTMEERVNRSLVPRRLPMTLALTFGLVALFLAAVGIYGVLAWRVGERRREISIRMAVGSTTREIFDLVLRDGLRITLLGLAGGVLGMLAVMRVITRLLYGVRPADPLVIAIVLAVLASVALLATLIPALRASRVNPIVALND